MNILQYIVWKPCDRFKVVSLDNSFITVKQEIKINVPDQSRLISTKYLNLILIDLISTQRKHLYQKHCDVIITGFREGEYAHTCFENPFNPFHFNIDKRRAEGKMYLCEMNNIYKDERFLNLTINDTDHWEEIYDDTNMIYLSFQFNS